MARSIVILEARGFMFDCGISPMRAKTVDDATVIAFVDRNYDGGMMGFVRGCKSLFV